MCRRLPSRACKGFDVSVFFGIVAPAGTPPDRIAKLNKAFAEVLASPKVKAVVRAAGPGSPHRRPRPQQLAKFIPAQMALSGPAW